MSTNPVAAAAAAAAAAADLATGSAWFERGCESFGRRSSERESHWGGK